ncbi:hypothetical protein AAT17_03100 [Nonlabens sp. MIC269]|uniref:HYC_CC_PP family protein n=1 Tax=Nonlabens TaxID=363408 RepID=UPI0005A8B69A|nr:MULTISPECIES: hypothetical protein [Nonlabens]ALM20304.1 hypothetical protein AAT17_03100 [Nonlabens sp. MIC269]
MKILVHKTLSVLMAFVVLFTTMSFTIDMHYCGETLVDFSFNASAKTCGMEKVQAEKTCNNLMMKEKSCCSNKQIVKESNEDLKMSLDKVTFEQQIFVAVFTYSYLNLFESAESEDLAFEDYPPPFLERDIQVLHQTFLI